MTAIALTQVADEGLGVGAAHTDDVVGDGGGAYVDVDLHITLSAPVALHHLLSQYHGR